MISITSDYTHNEQFNLVICDTQVGAPNRYNPMLHSINPQLYQMAQIWNIADVLNTYCFCESVDNGASYGIDQNTEY